MLRDEGRRMRGERMSVKEEGRGCGSELGSYLDLALNPDPDP